MIKKVLLILVVIVIAAIFFVPGMIIKGAVESFGSDLLQTDVKLESASLSLFSGDLILEGLEVSNPKGFNSKSALYIGKFDIKIDVSSLFSDKIHIKSVKLLNSSVTYEKTATSDNLSTLGKKYGKSYKNKGKNIKNSPNNKNKKTVIIDYLLIDGMTINTLLSIGGQKVVADVPMPKIEMKNIGKKYSLTFAQAITDVLLRASEDLTKVITRNQINNIIKNSRGNLGNIIKNKIPMKLKNFLK